MLDFAIFAVTFLLALVGAVLYLYPVTAVCLGPQPQSSARCGPPGADLRGGLPGPFPPAPGHRWEHVSDAAGARAPCAERRASERRDDRFVPGWGRWARGSAAWAAAPRDRPRRSRRGGGPAEGCSSGPAFARPSLRCVPGTGRVSSTWAVTLPNPHSIFCCAREETPLLPFLRRLQALFCVVCLSICLLICRPRNAKPSRASPGHAPRAASEADGTSAVASVSHVSGARLPRPLCRGAQAHPSLLSRLLPCQPQREFLNTQAHVVGESSLKRVPQSTVVVV